MPSGRPASIRTRRITRNISDAEAAILAHAGQGDVSAGFRYVINFYWQSVNMRQKADIQPEKQSVTDKG